MADIPTMRRISFAINFIAILLMSTACTLVLSPKPPLTPTPTATATKTSVPPTDTPTLQPTPTETQTPFPTETAVPPTTIPPSSPTVPPPTETPAADIPTATVAPTAAAPTTPPPTPTPAPTSPPYSGNAPTVTEGSITINTYDYQSALVATQPDDPVYPYPRLDHGRVGPPSPKTYRTIVLENRYTQLTILPDLGGRIYKWIDKVSGNNLFYENPVIKPTQWGNRGWWLATGGMEWALPTDEHGLSEASPWNYETYQDDENAGVVLGNTEKHSGLQSEIIISLDTDHSYFTLIPRIFNPTDAPVNYKFWINGMFTLGAPTLTPGIEFVLPTDSVTIHSTSDPTLPAPGETIPWPLFNGRDFSRYDNWTNYLGIFAAPHATADFMGAYNHTTNLGVARIFPAELVSGAKIFGLGELDPSLWTDDGSRYFELWGGVAPTFWDERTLNPGEWITWQERWYAVGDMGGFKTATENAALNLGLTADSVEVAAISTHPLAGTLILRNGETEVTRWGVTLSPALPFRGSYTPAAADLSTADWNLSLVDGSGQTVASLGNAPPTVVAAPVPSPTPVAAQPTPTAAPVSPVGDEPPVWDPRLDELGITLTRAQANPGQPVYRLVAARYWDESESNMMHHIFIEVIDEYGQRMLNIPVVMAWADGQTTAITEDKPSPEYAANFPMYDYLGKYSAYVDGAPSDIVSGMGLPAHHHVSFLLTFQKQ